MRGALLQSLGSRRALFFFHPTGAPIEALCGTACAHPSRRSPASRRFFEGANRWVYGEPFPSAWPAFFFFFFLLRTCRFVALSALVKSRTGIVPADSLPPFRIFFSVFGGAQPGEQAMV